MRLLSAAKGLFHHESKPDSQKADEPPLFDSGIGTWMMYAVVLALIAVVLGAVIKAAYLSIFH